MVGAMSALGLTRCACWTREIIWAGDLSQSGQKGGFLCFFFQWVLNQTFSISHRTQLMAQACYPERWFSSCLMPLCWAPLNPSSRQASIHTLCLQCSLPSALPWHLPFLATLEGNKQWTARSSPWSWAELPQKPCWVLQGQIASLPQRWGGLALLEIVWASCDGSCPDVESWGAAGGWET